MIVEMISAHLEMNFSLSPVRDLFSEATPSLEAIHAEDLICRTSASTQPKTVVFFLPLD
jgi:hypothetical protein